MRGMARGYAAGDSRGPGWREIAGTLGQLQAGRQAGSGMACSRAKARLNWVSQGQRRGRCKVRRRAERVIRPTRAKTRRLRVLVITVRSPRPIRAVQRARLCAITWTASQAPLAAKRPEGRWFSPTPYLRSRIAFSTARRSVRDVRAPAPVPERCQTTGRGFAAKRRRCLTAPSGGSSLSPDQSLGRGLPRSG